MILKVFSIFDSKVGAYLQPFFSPSQGAALRAIQDCVDDEKHNFSKYAGDFTLFELGTWDDGDTHFKLHSTPISVMLFSELKSMVERKVSLPTQEKVRE